MENKYKLTRREIQLLKMFGQGKTSKECAEELFISYFTVETHRKNIHRKLGTHKLINATSAYITVLVRNFPGELF
ncbi:MAG TPA: LuxR C-terminal-related transcriptional regulator [Parafilimonas sp.]|nr:LuxR C-terminal-related transcriptional regulator [Parafilimonas sp.]